MSGERGVGVGVVPVTRAGRGVDKRFVTADGYEIRDGSRLYDYYDCRPVTISFELTEPERKYWDGWFRGIADDGSGTLLDGSRLQGRPRGGIAPLEQPARWERLRTLADGGAVLASDGSFGGRPREVAWQPRMAGDPAPFVCPATGARFLPQNTTAREAEPDVIARAAGTDEPVTDVQTAALAALVDDDGSGLDALMLMPVGTMRAVEIALLRVRPDVEKQGYGRRALDVIGRWADLHGVTLVLTPEPAPAPGQRPKGKAWLYEWYRRAGFTRNRGRRVEHRVRAAMLRRPGSGRTARD